MHCEEEILKHWPTGVKILRVNAHASYTREQLEKMLTELRELTLMSSSEAKVELKRPRQSALRQWGW